ncbi:S-adenosyl-L-methionine-dependent methyltransferase [Xylariaceae sp. FL0804]|nr:S-adenosyl-L-methionine-dependent methyltransferase [Xylariaceae sp. FL0804]
MATHPSRSDTIEAASSIVDSLRNHDGKSLGDAERVQLLQKAKELTMLLEGPEDGLIKLASSSAILASMRICVDLNIFPIIAERAETSAAELSAKTGADETLIRRILRPLTATSWIAERGPGQYGPSPWTARLATDAGKYTVKFQHDFLMPCIGSAAAWFRDAGYANPQDPKDAPFQRAFGAKGTEAFPWMAAPGNEEIWDSANGFFEGDRGSRPSWVTWFPVREKLLSGLQEEEVGGTVLVDVGGGRGHDISEFLAQFPDLAGRLVLQDQQAVLDSAVSLPSRIEKLGINFWEESPVRDSRIYFMKFIMHDYNDEQCAKILKNVAGSMKKGYSQLVLNDFIVAEVECSQIAAHFDVMVMAALAGGERTESQWKSLLKLAGLSLDGLYQPPGDGQGIIVASLA